MINKALYLFPVMLLAAALVFLTAAQPALAFDGRTGDTVTIASGEVINDDLYLAGGDIIIDGTVNGDVYAVGRNITVNGNIEGSATIGGQFVTINGSIKHSVRLMGQTISVNGETGRDAVLLGQNVAVTSRAKIGRDVVLGANSVSLNGDIAGRVTGGAGNVVISGTVAKDVTLGVDTLTVAATADIGGNLEYTSESEAAIQPGAKIAGTTNRIMPEISEAAKRGPASEIPGKILGFLMAFVVGLVLIFIATRRLTGMSDALVRHPWHCLGWGAFLLFITPFAIIILCITVVGIPLGLILLALYAIAIYLSIIPVALCIGRLIVARNMEPTPKGILLGALALGLVIITLLKLIPVAGFVVGLAVVLFGMGTLIVSYTRMRS